MTRRDVELVHLISKQIQHFMQRYSSPKTLASCVCATDRIKIFWPRKLLAENEDRHWFCMPMRTGYTLTSSGQRYAWAHIVHMIVRRMIIKIWTAEYKIKADFWKTVKLETGEIDPSWNDTITVRGSGQSTKGEGRIAYGTVASIGQFPFMARLAVIGPKTYSMCGGTVISPYHVLTAGEFYN